MSDGAWHPDPSGAASWRWWNGYTWDERTAPSGPAPGLEPLTRAVGYELTLNRWGSGGELRSGGAVFARFDGVGGNVVAAHAHEGSWSFDPQGVIARRVHVHVLPPGALIAQFDWRGGGGLPGSHGGLVFGDGREFLLPRTDDADGDRGNFLDRLGTLLKPSWTFVDAQAGPIITADYIHERTVRLRSEPAAAHVTGFPLLTLTAVYLAWSALESQEAHERMNRINR